MYVHEILKEKGSRVVTIKPEHNVGDLVALLNSEKIGGCVVSEDGGIVAGIITERDVVRQLAIHGADLMTMAVADVMTRHVKTCSPDHTIDDIMGMMTKQRFRHVPIVRNDRLIGIISIGDVVRARVEQLEMETETLRHYIAGT